MVPPPPTAKLSKKKKKKNAGKNFFPFNKKALGKIQYT